MKYLSSHPAQPLKLPKLENLSLSIEASEQGEAFLNLLRSRWIDRPDDHHVSLKTLFVETVLPTFRNIPCSIPTQFETTFAELQSLGAKVTWEPCYREFSIDDSNIRTRLYLNFSPPPAP